MKKGVRDVLLSDETLALKRIPMICVNMYILIYLLSAHSLADCNCLTQSKANEAVLVQPGTLDINLKP